MSAVSPPLSPWLLLGLVLRPLPLMPLQPALKVALHGLRRRHPGLFDRLGELGDRVFLIHPVELPFALRLGFTDGEPDLRACPSEPAEAADAVVRGPLVALVELLDGRTDGDALFFSRRLWFEGDTAAVVALRNALDGAGIDLFEDLLQALGVFRGPARRMLGLARRLVGRLEGDLETIRSAALEPVSRELGALQRRLQAVEAVPRERPRRSARLGA